MKVFVYYNLHKHVWSVKALEGPDKGRVVARSEFVHLKNVKPKVSEAGRQRVIREQRKNVHAGMVGELMSLNPMEFDGLQVKYSPYSKGTFFYAYDNETDFERSDEAYLEMRKVFVL